MALGEDHYYGWWKSQFLSPTGLSYLERLYPRSYFTAAVQSSSHAAQIVHDKSIGKGDVYHLFRLPVNVETDIDALMTEDEWLELYRPLLSNRDQLLTSLGNMAEKFMVGANVGPLRLPGPIENHVSEVAGLYLTAFQTSTTIYPYFPTTVSNE